MEVLNNEIELIAALKNPKVKDKAFKTLLDNYQERLYWHIRKLVLIHEDANDVLQNTFLKIYKSIHTFHQDSSLHTWMYRIAYNESMNLLAEKNKKSFISSEEVTTKILNNLQEDVYFDGDEIKLKLHKALLELPEKQRQVFNMKYFDELKFREISEILGTTEGALKASYHIAVKKIEEYLVGN
ncbi:RNA polymerase sigma factor [Lutibacter sp.]|uniref:RNA polymerase sigma factor n=1 Tax=Lutibacter sp. TaxID=1925666 RepID=UPI003566E11C